MDAKRKPDVRRGEMAFIFAIVLGLLLGAMIKNIRIGLVIGVVLGLIIVFTGWLRINRK